MTRKLRAFTMTELLITIALIFLLASLIVVSLHGVRAAANRTESANALKQMALAFNAYSADNRQYFMPGYMDVPKALGIDAKKESGDVHDEEDTASYVWRLAPYLDHNWKTMFVDYRSKELQARITAEQLSGAYGPGTLDQWTQTGEAMGTSSIPSFGMNTTFIGGDNVHGGGGIVALNPWDNPSQKLAATRYTEVKNPARVLVFAPCSNYLENDGDDATSLFDPSPVSKIHLGDAALRPPYITLQGVDTEPDPSQWEWIDRQWRIADEDETAIAPVSSADFTAGGGCPIARWGGKLPAAHIDGSVSIRALEEYAFDMRMWSPFTSTQQHSTDQATQ